MNRIVDKGLAVMQFTTWTNEERKQKMQELPPGYLTAERNAAMRLTEAGAVQVARLREARV